MGINNKTKCPRESSIEMTELVLPSDTNYGGNLLAGRLMHWIDVAGSMAAFRHSEGGAVTIAVDKLDFKRPIKVGCIVTLKAKVTWVGNTSMEVKIDVFGENYITGEKEVTNTAYFIFVAVDDKGNLITVPRLKPETEEEISEYENGKKRREERLKRLKL